MQSNVMNISKTTWQMIFHTQTDVALYIFHHISQFKGNVRHDRQKCHKKVFSITRNRTRNIDSKFVSWSYFATTVSDSECWPLGISSTKQRATDANRGRLLMAHQEHTSPVILQVLTDSQPAAVLSQSMTHTAPTNRDSTGINKFKL